MGHKNDGMQQRTHGQISRYLMNHHGEIEGILLDNGISVRFGCEYGSAVMSALKPGQDISVEGRANTKTSEFHGLKAHTFQILKSGETLRLKDLAKTQAPAEAEAHQHQHHDLSGLFQELIYNDNNDIDGLLLQDGNLVRIPPHEAKRLVTLPLVRGVTKVDASGEGSNTEFGTVVKADELKLDSLSFLKSSKAS